jgi:hypothetical protein
MRRRGVDDPESLLSATTADRIIATCLWADREHASKRLLVWKIKQGGIDPGFDDFKSRRQLQEERFLAITQHFPAGTPTEPHRELQRRRDYEVDCTDGLLIVAEPPRFPVLVTRCDECGFETAYPLNALRVLTGGGRTAT